MIFHNQPMSLKQEREAKNQWLDKSLADTKKAVAATRSRIAKIHAEGREVNRTAYLTKVGRAQEILGKPGVQLYFNSDLDSIVELKEFKTLDEARAFAGRMKDYLGKEMNEVRKVA